jgi:hypothetical protein
MDGQDAPAPHAELDEHLPARGARPQPVPLRLRDAQRRRQPLDTKWAWEVTGAGGGAEVTVSWDVYLKTADRKFFGGPLRKRQLAREVPNSLTAIAEAVMATEPR